MIEYTCLPCPFGDLWVAQSSEGLVAAHFGMDELRFTCTIAHLGNLHYRPDGLPQARAQFAQYFAGERRAFSLPLDLSSCRPFARAVLEAVRAVRWGEVASYSQIARTVGRPQAARAVGAAVGGNPITIVIPCHRIVRADGTCGLYGSSGVHVKQALLRAEGISLPPPCP